MIASMILCASTINWDALIEYFIFEHYLLTGFFLIIIIGFIKIFIDDIIATFKGDDGGMPWLPF